eukprot:g3769.t1
MSSASLPRPSSRGGGGQTQKPMSSASLPRPSSRVGGNLAQKPRPRRQSQENDRTAQGVFLDKAGSALGMQTWKRYYFRPDGPPSNMTLQYFEHKRVDESGDQLRGEVALGGATVERVEVYHGEWHLRIEQRARWPNPAATWLLRSRNKDDVDAWFKEFENAAKHRPPNIGRRHESHASKFGGALGMFCDRTGKLGPDAAAGKVFRMRWVKVYGGHKSERVEYFASKEDYQADRRSLGHIQLRRVARTAKETLRKVDKKDAPGDIFVLQTGEGSEAWWFRAADPADRDEWCQEIKLRIRNVMNSSGIDEADRQLLAPQNSQVDDVGGAHNRGPSSDALEASSIPVGPPPGLRKRFWTAIDGSIQRLKQHLSRRQAALLFVFTLSFAIFLVVVSEPAQRSIAWIVYSSTAIVGAVVSFARLRVELVVLCSLFGILVFYPFAVVVRPLEVAVTRRDAKEAVSNPVHANLCFTVDKGKGNEHSGGQLAHFQKEVDAERGLVKNEPLTVKQHFVPLSNFLLIFSFWFFWAQITAISFVPDIPWGFTWLGDIWRIVGELLLLTLIDLDWFDLPLWFGTRYVEALKNRYNWTKTIANAARLVSTAKHDYNDSADRLLFAEESASTDSETTADGILKDIEKCWATVEGDNSRLELKMREAWPEMFDYIEGDSYKQTGGFEGDLKFNKKAVRDVKGELSNARAVKEEHNAAKKKAQAAVDEAIETHEYDAKEAEDAEKKLKDLKYTGGRTPEEDTSLQILQKKYLEMTDKETELKGVLAQAKAKVSTQKEEVKQKTIGDKWEYLTAQALRNPPRYVTCFEGWHSAEAFCAITGLLFLYPSAMLTRPLFQALDSNLNMRFDYTYLFVFAQLQTVLLLVSAFFPSSPNLLLGVALVADVILFWYFWRLRPGTSDPINSMACRAFGLSASMNGCSLLVLHMGEDVGPSLFLFAYIGWL